MSLFCSGLFRIGAEIQTLHSQRPSKGKVGRREISRERTTEPSGFSPDIEIHDQTIRRTVRFDRNRRMKQVAGENRHDPPHLRHRDGAVTHELDDRRPKIAFDHAGHVDGTLTRSEREVLEVQIVVTDRDPAGHLLQDEIRIGATKAQIPDLDREVHRLVSERGPHIEIIDALGQPVGTRGRTIVDRHRTVDDRDRRKRHRPTRAAAIGLLLTLAYELADVPPELSRTTWTRGSISVM